MAAEIIVKVTPNDKGNPAGKLAEAELHFLSGPLSGLKLIGFAIWERRGGGRNVTFPPGNTRSTANATATHCYGPSSTPAHRSPFGISCSTPGPRTRNEPHSYRNRPRRDAPPRASRFAQR